MLTATTQPSGRLGNTDEIFVGRKVKVAPLFEPESEKWALLRVAGAILFDERVAECGKRILNSALGVELYRSLDTGGWFYGNIRHCGCLWVCPVCAQKITEKRRLELKTAVDIWKGLGGGLFLLTLTDSHHTKVRLRRFCDGLLSARTKMRNRTRWRGLIEDGLIGGVRNLEVTYGRNGWHPHIHELLFLAPGSKVTKEYLLDLISHEWRSACLVAGLPEPGRNGVDVSAGEDTAEYLAKWGLEPKQAKWGLDSELTKSHVKRGSAKGRTPFDFLRGVRDGVVEDQVLFREFHAAFKGRRQLVWTKGLKDRFGLLDKSDEELANERNQSAEYVGSMAVDDWNSVKRHDVRGNVLSIGKAVGVNGVDTFLDYLRGLDGRPILGGQVIRRNRGIDGKGG